MCSGARRVSKTLVLLINLTFSEVTYSREKNAANRFLALGVKKLDAKKLTTPVTFSPLISLGSLSSLSFMFQYNKRDSFHVQYFNYCPRRRNFARNLAQKGFAETS